MTIIKIISGGQTGADQGGLEAGRRLEIPTGGMAPKNFRTDSGPNPKLKDIYNLIEHESYNYPPRTIENVKNSDGTVWFGNHNSPGGHLTIKTCMKLNKPWITNPSVEDFKIWIEQNNIKILNVAGNRENSSPGIYKRVIQFLVNALTDFQKEV